jgi:hypothetical protein
MIRVVITGPPSGTGYLPYKIESWALGRPQFVGVSRLPLLDACRQLQQAGVMDDTVVGLFDQDADRDEWRMRTTVGYGARYGSAPPVAGAAVDAFLSTAGGGVPGRPKNAPTSLDAGVPIEENEMGPYREFPGGPLKGAPDRPGELRDDRRDFTAAPLAKPAASPPAPRTPPAPPDDRDQVPAEPPRLEKSHHRPRPKGSGGRRGSRSGR